MTRPPSEGSVSNGNRKGSRGLAGLGGLFFATAMAGFGVQYFIYAFFRTGIGPPWFAGPPFWACFAGAMLIAMAVVVIIDTETPWAAGLLGLTLFLFFLSHVPRVVAAPHDGGERSSAFEMLAMCGFAMVLAGVRSAGGDSMAQVLTLGRLFVAASMIVFGIDHYIYAAFVAALVPAWLPGGLFWAYLTGTAFVAAGVSIGTKIRITLAATLLGVMFLAWILILHGPRVAASPHNGQEWTSAFVALAMLGGSWILTADTRARLR